MPVADQVRALPAPRFLVTVALGLTAVAVVLGGGGSPAPGTEFAAELAALVALAAAVARGWRPTALLLDRPWTVLAAAVVVLPLAQLVPLPPVLWQALPGRELARSALAANGEGDAWQPWSLLPDGGVAAVLALLPAIAAALLTASLPATARVRVIAGVAVLGAVAALLGLVQFARGADAPLSFYADIHRGFGIGFFANRNAQADFVAIALTAGVLCVERHRDRLDRIAPRTAVVLAGMLMLSAGLATGSRMGIVLLAVPLLTALPLAGRRAPWLAGAVAALMGWLLIGGTALDRVVARAQDAGNRTEIWGDSLFVARAVAPVGAGMGSFVPLYAAAERLDHVQPTIANRAHNDFLELAIEGGVPALTLLAAVLALVVRRAAVGWRDADPDRRLLVRFAGLTALILAVHSTVDYPLRTVTLLTVAGIAFGGLAGGVAPARAGPQNGRRRGVSHA